MSARPRERCGMAVLADAVQLDPQRAHTRPGRTRSGERRVHRMRYPGEPCRLVRAFRPEILDLDIGEVADPHRVARAVIDELDRSGLHPEHLTDERVECCRGTTALAGADRGERF